MQPRLLSLMLAALLSPSAMAGGLALYETSTANSALANAGSAARAQGADTIASNPAGMTKLEGTQLQVNGGVVYGDLELDLDNGGNNGGNALQTAPLGSLYLTHAIDDQWVSGIGVFGSHGLGIDYGDGWDGRGYTQSAKLTGIAFAPSLAYRIDSNWSVGASLIAMNGSLEASVDLTSGMGKGGILQQRLGVWRLLRGTLRVGSALPYRPELLLRTEVGAGRSALPTC